MPATRKSESQPAEALAAPLSDMYRQALAAALEHVLKSLGERTFSPRIRFLDIKQVAAATGLGASTIYRLITKGHFPKPQLNLGKKLWRESTLIAWANANDPNSEY